jgi:hypothetical protein
MVAAYLRGLLKPDLPYGLRSELAEEAILEAMVVEMQVDHQKSAIAADAAALPIFTDTGKDKTLRAIQARLARCIELRTMDIYRLDASKKPTGGKNDISLYQLYHLAAKHGILDALQEYNNEQDVN